MRHFRSLPVLAIRRMLGNWRLFASVAAGTLAAGAILASAVVYADAIRDLGLEFALDAEPIESLDLRLTQGNVAVRGALYAQSRERIDRAVRDALGRAAGAAVRQGTTATFYASAPGGEPDLGDQSRPRANLRWRTNLLEHAALVAGRLPAPSPAGAPEAAGRPIEALLGAATARAHGFAPGDRLDLHPFWDEEIPPLAVEIVGLLEARDLSDRYWNARSDALDARTAHWPTLLLFVPEESFFGSHAEAIPSTTARYVDVYRVERGGLDSRNAGSVARGAAGLERRLGASEPLLRVDSDLAEVLETFDDKLFFVRIPLFVLLLQIGGVAGYYLLVVSTMLVERQAAEIATLRSRGATTAQLLAQYGVEAAILAALAVLAGPPLAAAAISALGPTPAFSGLSGGGPLDVHLSAGAFALAGGGALIAFAAFMVPAWQATRRTVAGFKREAARPRREPLFLRCYLDVALAAALALIFWRLRRERDLFGEPLFGEPQADPFLLATPAVAMLTAGVVFLRLFPLALRLAAWIVARGRGVALLVGARALARNPTHYSRLILLLMLATGVGMFGATFSATLDRSYDDRARYAVGADVRAVEPRALYDRGDAAFLDAVAAIPAAAVSPVIRSGGAAYAHGASARVEVLGVEPDTFGEVAWFRADFAPRPLASMLEELADNAAEARERPLPADARQFGVWAKFPDIRAAVDLVAVFRGAGGRIARGWLGVTRPGDPATAEWRFFSLDLDRMRGSSGVPRPETLQRPIAMQALLMRTRSAIGAQRGVMLLGPALTSPLPPPEGPARGFPPPAAAPFAGAVLAHDLTAPGFEVLQGAAPRRLGDRVRAVDDAPPGHAAALRYEWLDEERPPQRRGLRQAIDGEPAAAFLSRGTAERLGLAPGDALQLAVAGAYLDARFAGAFEFFPTFDARGGDGLALVHASRLRVDANAALPNRPLAYDAAWFASDDPAATAAALAALDPRQLHDVERERRRQERDPLIAAGWEGILAISFGAVLLLAAIGFLIYSYLTAQQRRLEFAVLRTLGFSRAQVFGVVLLEQLFVVLAGMGLGTIVGLRVGRLMMDFFEIDERGAEVLPPFALAVSRPEVALVWGILGAVFVLTVAAVVALYVRLALHRALRVGDA